MSSVAEPAEPPIRLDRRALPHARVPFRRALVPLFRKIAYDAAAPASAMFVRPSNLAPTWIPRQPLCRTGSRHRYQHDAAAVRRDVVLKLSMLVPRSKRSAVLARPPTTPPARTTPTPVGASLSRAAHCLSPQACQSAQLLATARAVNAGRRLFPLLRDCLPALPRFPPPPYLTLRKVRFDAGEPLRFS